MKLEGFKTLNSTIATERLPVRETKIKHGFATLSSAVGTSLDLIRLVVLAGNERIPPGTFVWVSSDGYNTPWGKTFYSINDLSFILIPESQIVLMEC
jgi:hypothetical protein